MCLCPKTVYLYGLNSLFLWYCNRYIFRVTCPLWGESTGHRWIPLTKVSNASVTSNHMPRTILAPVRFLARKAEWSDRRNFTPVLFSWSHRSTGPGGLQTAEYLWFDWIIRRLPLRAYGPCTGISHVFHIIRDLTGQVRGPQECRIVPLRTRKRTDRTRIWKNLARAPCGHSPYGPHAGYLRFLNP